MSPTATALAAFAAMLVLIGLRAPVALAMLLVGSAGYAYLQGPVLFFAFLKSSAYHLFANYTLSVIPLFILMGAFAERAGIATALFQSAARSFGKARGGLAMAVIAACAGFGAICGSSVATTATFGRAALPELDRYRYNGGFSTSVIAVGGTLGILIPPSVILVIYAISTEQNIAKLFQAALVPGLLATAFYCITIAIVVRLRPGLAPSIGDAVSTPAAPRSWLQRAVGLATVFAAPLLWWFASLSPLHASLVFALGVAVAVIELAVMPALIVAAIVIGGIYGGVFTPTEGAAVGAIAMLAIGLGQRTLSLVAISHSIRQTAVTSGMIFMILLGSELFGSFLALSGLPAAAAQFISTSGLSPYVVLVGMLAFYILLGALMDEIAMLLLTLPVFFPVIQALDFGMPPDEVAIWFGILVLIVVGIGLTAPPIGLNVFVISAIARGVPMTSTYVNVLPFIAADILRLGLVVAVPGLALWLVRALN